MATFKTTKSDVTVFCDCGKFSHKVFIDDGEVNVDTQRIQPDANKEPKEDEGKNKKQKKGTLAEFFEDGE